MLEKQIVLRGGSEHPHEQEALEFMRRVLPDTPTVLAWELVEFIDPSTGRLLEIDALVLGYRALYLIEIKGGPGVYSGDTADWYRQPADGPPRYMAPPLKLTNLKAKVLKGLLERRLDKSRLPWVQPLVFLSHESVELKLRNFGDQCVVTRKNLARAITHHEFPGSNSERLPRPINAPAVRDLRQALKEIGIRQSQGVLRVGAYELKDVLEQGPGFEDRLAVHSDNTKFLRRARCYLVPQQTSTERRQQLRRAANREAQLLEDVKVHPNILRISDYIPDAPLGPTVLFDHFDGIRLDAFLRQHPDLSFVERVHLIEQIGRALSFCHKKEVHHGSLSPASVLVSRSDSGQLDCRLYNFQLGSGAEVAHTQHWSALSDDEWAAYQAPELRESPSAPRGPADLFSLGALSYFILTGVPPAKDAASADERIRKEHHFDPRVVSDALEADIANCVTTATEWNPVNRFDDAGEFVEFLLELATRPAPPPPELSPLEAKKDDELGGFIVKRVLGQGASSRVLEVQRKSDDREFALKVALNETEGSRLLEEAELLKELRHQRIVQLFDTPKLAGSQCLLLAIAGTDTLQRRLKLEGLVSLDYAARFGEDLLLALEQLEEQQILHRDIKPANIGVGPIGKRAHHLVLFDFSLGVNLRDNSAARHGLSQLSIGTVAYRDPYLVDRGAWDFAADRWSAAVTLHEMLTGVRPTWTPNGCSPRDPEAKLSLAAERFDPSVRDRLVRFFSKALSRDATERQVTASEMRAQWNRCFASSISGELDLRRVNLEQSVTVEASDVNAAEAAVDALETSPPFDFGAVARSAPIAALPFSARALNALDRAGVTLVGELASLPDNRLSAVRGVGKLVVQEVIKLKRRWVAAHTTDGETSAAMGLYPGYTGHDAALATTSLPPELLRAFEDAGISSLGALAGAPSAQVERLAARAGSTLAAVKKLLADAQQEEDQRAHPQSVDGWLKALLPRRKTRNHHLAALFGLTGPYAGRTDVSAAELAKALSMTAPNIYIALNKAKVEWQNHPGIDELQRNVRELTLRAGGALEISSGAHKLCDTYPPRPELDELLPDVPTERRVDVAAAALLRIVSTVEKDQEDGLRWERLSSGKPWLLLTPELTTTLEALGKAADELALRQPLAASSETLRVLRLTAEGSAFERVSDERLTEIAAEASTSAARSSRLELYPRGLSADRALQLSSAALTGKITPEQIHKRVRARYPEAAELPPRPELDRLLEGYGLTWSESTGVFERPEQSHGSHFTQPWSSVISSPTQRTLEASQIQASDFEERVRIALERGRFRVINVRKDLATIAALALRDRFKLKPVDLDKTFIQAVQGLMKENGVDEELVHRTDWQGAHGKDWQRLCDLAGLAAERMSKKLSVEKQPLLLFNPGLIARYRLSDFLKWLIRQCRETDDKPVFLLVPSPDTAGVPAINGTMVIPEVGIADTLNIPKGWLQEVRRPG